MKCETKCSLNFLGDCQNAAVRLREIKCPEFKKPKQTEKDKVNHPNHYTYGKHEVIDIIEDWKMNYHLGNAIKYIARCERKGNKKQDLETAIWYIKRELAKSE